MLCITVTSAYARELRDRRIAAWFARVSDEIFLKAGRGGG